MNLDIIVTSFLLGLLATTSPCILPLYPGYLAYLSSGQAHGTRMRYFYGFFILAGVLVMMLSLGFAIATLSVSVGRALSILIPVADVIIIGLGILLLLDINLFKMLPLIQTPILSHPFANAFLYGLLYGPVALPCSGPLVVGIFAFSLTAEEVAGKLMIFLWFGLGFGLPLLVLSFLSGAVQRWITRLFAVHSRKINLAGGILLVGAGVFDFVQNWPLVAAYLS